MHKYIMECSRGMLRKYKFFVIAADRFDALARATAMIAPRKDLNLKLDTLRIVRRERGSHEKYA